MSFVTICISMFDRNRRKPRGEMTMMNSELRKRVTAAGWLSTLCLFTLAILFGASQTAHGQWTTNGNNINNTNSGNVGVGTTTPAAKVAVTTNSASVNATVSITPDATNNYYANNPHDALFVDGSLLAPHGTYTGAAVRLFRLRSQQSVDSFIVGRNGDALISPHTENISYTLKLGPDANSAYYAGSDHDILLISGSGYNSHGVYTSKTLRPLRVTNASGGDTMAVI